MGIKFSLIACCLTLLTVSANAQRAKISSLYNYVTEKRKTVKPESVIFLFEKSAAVSSTEINNILLSKQVLSLSRKGSRELYKKKPLTISLFIPSAGSGYQLELVQEDISNGILSAGTLSGKGVIQKTSMAPALHYRGYIAGDPASIAGFSIFSNGEVMGLFCSAEGNFNIGKLENNSEQYILYNSRHMLVKLPFECGTDKLPVIGNNKQNGRQDVITGAEAVPSLLCKKVRIYWEADYKLYSNNFSSNLTNTVNYLTGLFNQVAVMYQNEGILIELTATYVWTSADSYNTSSSNNGLAAIKNRWNGLGNDFNADLCVLIDGAPTNNGGVAYLLDNDLCNRTYAYGYSDIYATYNTVPAYSWDVEELSHEMGHMMGSHHTHWCGWNTGTGGSCGAIDNCSPVESSLSCTSCAAATNTNPAAPAGFMGTVMSYCYLRDGIGVNLSYGFGPLPQVAMRSSITNAVCPLLDNKWSGAANSAWENPGNWSCGSIPTSTTDVTIVSGLINYPIVNSAAVCRKIKQQHTTSVTVKPGFTLNVTGKE